MTVLALSRILLVNSEIDHATVRLGKPVVKVIDRADNKSQQAGWRIGSRAAKL